jgi:hypothetical protein
VDAGPEDDAKFPEVDRYLMIFRGSLAYESHRQRRIIEQEVKVIHTLAALT